MKTHNHSICKFPVVLPVFGLSEDSEDSLETWYAWCSSFSTTVLQWHSKCCL